MRQEVELFLAGQSVEFAEPPEILFSYIRTDYTDPTVLRNSYSKTLTIEGTPNNNQLFSSIYHLDSVADTELFNPAKRMEFQLYSNGDILEQGYAKLDKVNKDGKNISYDITLYGGLGEFLYNLSYDQTIEGSDTSRGGGEDRRLSSLVFYNETEPNKEFDFEITKETVAEAWEALEKGTGATKWQYINFAPAYNGYPKDFDADKVLINTQNSTVPLVHNNNGEKDSTDGFPRAIKQNDTTYRTYNNYAIGEMPKEMTEWEMRDLRSYLQRPVMSMKGFIQAISNPINNGGYNVVLDPKFFNANNPYYEKAWVTLPQLKKDETETGQSAKTQADNNVLSVSSQLGENYDVRYYLQGLQPGSVYNGVNLTFSFNVNMPGMPDEVYTTVYDYDLGLFGRDAGYFSSIFVQLVGEDENGNAIAASPIYNFTSPYGDEKEFWFIGLGKGKDPDKYCTRKSNFTSTYTPDVERDDDIDCKGRFVRTSGNNYVWKNIDGQTAFTASLTDTLEYHNVYFRVTKCYHWREKKNGNPTNLNCFEEQIFTAKTGTEVSRRNILGGYVGRWLDRCGFMSVGSFYSDTITASTAVTNVQIVGSQVQYTVVSDVVRSGEHISKGDLLNFDGTPCDYLLSYCKLFNLYLSKDIYSNTIYIRTRDSFYNGGTIDLDQYIDRSKEIKVSPLAMESRWYDFAYPEDEMCGAAEDYDFNYGVEYGKNKVQTTYEFDSAAKNLFEDNIYQNGVQVQESSKYFTLRTASGKTVPTFLYNSINYQLFATPNDSLSSCAILPPSAYTQAGYTSNDSKEDWLPKLQLNNDNDPIDGTNVLCFYGGFKSSPTVGSQQVIYYLTDDLAEMYVINGETPCWLWTKGEDNGDVRIAKGMTKLPVFSRMLYDRTGEKIEYTWDFGRVRNTYVPVKTYVDKATIFERWWANYVADLYNANTRVVEAYVKMEGKVVGDWLRAFYWWDNCYWVLTEINDYNITSYATTRCKFVKVNDIANYTDGITPPTAVTPTATLVPSTYMIPATGSTIGATVKTSDGGSWHLEYPDYVHPSQVAGTGDTNITLRFDSNPNTDGREFDIRTYRVDGTRTHFWQEGGESIEKELGIDRNRLLFDYNAHSYSSSTITYRNRGTDTVTISTNADWLSVSQAPWNGENAILSVSMSANTGTSVRSATIMISANTSHLVTYAYLDQLPQYFTINNNGGSVTGDLINQFSISALNAFWADIRTDGDTVTFSAPANTATTTRYESVLFTVADSGATSQIRQTGGGGMLSVSPTSLEADYSGGDRIITVQSDSFWSASSKPDWITLSQPTGTTGQSTVVVTFAENVGTSSRTGTITITDGTRYATVDVSQDYYIPEEYLTVSPTGLSVDYKAQSKFLTVTSSSNWTATPGESWMSFDVSTGTSGTSILTVNFEPLYTQLGRTAVINIVNATNALTVIAFQSGNTEGSLKVTPNPLYFEASGATKYMNVVDTDFSWRVTSKPDWIVLSQVTGDSGTTIVGATAAPNDGDFARLGEVIFTDGVYTVTETFVQPSSSTERTITLVPSLVSAENSGGTVSVEVHYNNRNGDDVSITSSESWVHPGYAQWTGESGTIDFVVDNYGVDLEREATITVTGILDSSATATMRIKQKASPYVTLNPVFIEFDNTGGTSTIVLQSNTDWIIDIDDDN